MKQKQKASAVLLAFLRTHARWLIALAMVVVGAYLAHKRYPLYFDQPNFYAEDGTVFTHTILHDGLLSALFTPFNGYFAVGLYLLEGVAVGVNTLLLGGGLLNLPVAIAVVSYTFWGLLAALPVALFWREAQHKSWLMLVGLSLALLPMPSFDYAVFGTLCNYKFAFLFIAFLLLVKRHLLPERSRYVYAIDAVLVICAFTNASVYLLLPFALLRYIPKKINREFWRGLVRKPSFISLVAMVTIAALQIAFVVLRGGIAAIPGYLDEPYELAKTIEIFLHRTILFPFDHLFAKFLNDAVVVVLTLALGVGLWRIARKEDRPILLFGFWAALSATALFVSQRTGVTQFFSDYHSSATDHFFYPQNLIIVFMTLYVVARSVEHTKRSLATIALTTALLCLLPITMAAHDAFDKPIPADRLVGSLKQNVQEQCRTTTDTVLQVPVYPGGPGVTMPLSREAYCR